MPLCVHCAYPADHLYTTYKTKSNIRLGVCPQCDQFLDPLIEHDPLILLLDLILLKPRVFLHLLFNRGSPPLDATSTETTVSDRDRKGRIQSDVASLFALVIVAEIAVRLISTTRPSWNQIIHVFVLVLFEVSAQHLATLLFTLTVLGWRNWYPASPKDRSSDKDGRRTNFTPLLVPLTLLYTSLLPLVLQLLLSIWYTPPITSDASTTGSNLLQILPGVVNGSPMLRQIILELEALWDHADRVWAGTRLLGGMSAGFGLRILLPTRPWETTGIVLAGWGAAALAGRIVTGMSG